MLRPLVSVFAVEDTAVQVVWRALPAPEVCLRAGEQAVTVTAPPPAMLHRRGMAPRPLVGRRGRSFSPVGGPGGAVIDGLKPATEYELVVEMPGGEEWVAQRFTTLEPPPGPLLCKFATVNDIHFGEHWFGYLKTIEEPHPLPPGFSNYSFRCTRAALDEALEWGAEAIVVKGDLTNNSQPNEFREIGEVLASLPVPVEVILGNHDARDAEYPARVWLAEHGIVVPDEPWARELPGVRLVMGHTEAFRHKGGHIDARQREQLVALTAGAGPAFVAIHHQLDRWTFSNIYPPGVPGPEANAFLDALASAHPNTYVATGHTHRHRRHTHGPVVVAEVGSTKDYPGTWAGYAVHEGGIRQVIRRIAEPSAIAWTEATAFALFGLWGLWSPGPRSERCFSHTWPEPA